MQDFIPILIDVLALCIMLRYIFKGYQNGFLYSILRLVGTIVSLIGAYATARAVAPLLSNPTRAYWLDWVGKTVGDVAGLDAATTESLLQTTLPESVWSLFGLFGITVGEQTSSGNLAEVLVDTAILPMVNGIIECVLFLIFFALFAFICRRIFNHFRTIRVPIIGTCNALLGALLGILQGGVMLLVFATIASIVLLLSGDSFSYFNTDILRHTHLFYWFYSMNPLAVV